METIIAYIQAQDLYTVISLGVLVVLLFVVVIYKVSHKPTTTFLENIQEDDVFDDVFEDDVLENTKDTIIKSNTKEEILEMLKSGDFNEILDKFPEGSLGKEILEKLIGDDLIISSHVEKTTIIDHTKDNVVEINAIEDDPSKVSIFVTDFGTNKLAVVKLIYEASGLGLKEVHEISESKGVIPFKVDLEQANQIMEALREVGAIAEIK